MNAFTSALTLAAAFRDVGLTLLPPPVDATAEDTTHHAELTPTNVILLYVVNQPHSLDLYDSLFAPATRTAVETDGNLTVFTYAP